MSPFVAVCADLECGARWNDGAEAVWRRIRFSVEAMPSREPTEWMNRCREWMNRCRETMVSKESHAQSRLFIARRSAWNGFTH